MSTTTILLPRPFIFTNAWPASALIGRSLHPRLYGEGLAPRQPLRMAAGLPERANHPSSCYGSCAAGPGRAAFRLGEFDAISAPRNADRREPVRSRLAIACANA